MDSTPPARRTGRDPLDERSEILGGCDRSRPAARDDRPADPSGLWLLAEATEERGELGCVEGREEVRSGDAPRRVEAHVERSACPDPEPAIGIGELEARQPE